MADPPLPQATQTLTLVLDETPELLRGIFRHAHIVTPSPLPHSSMRTALVLAALASLALTACSEPAAPNFELRACDQARIDLAIAQGRADYIDKDSVNWDKQTWEVWGYVVDDEAAGTETTTEYRFEWNTNAARTAPNACLRDTTVTTVDL